MMERHNPLTSGRTAESSLLATAVERRCQQDHIEVVPRDLVRARWEWPEWVIRMGLSGCAGSLYID